MPSLLKAKGLQTFHNELKLPEGALLTADNIVIDRNDVVRPRRGFGDYGCCGLNPPACPCPCSGIRVCQLIAYKDRILLHYCCRVHYDCECSAGCFTPFTGTVSATCSGIRIKSVESNGNLYLTTTEGIRKISGTLDACCATNFACGACTISCAGGPKGLNTSTKLNYEAGGFMPPLAKTAYRVVWGITDNNKNLILGAPSSRFVVGNIDECNCANVCVTTSIPTDVTTTQYFYQVYRSQVVCTCMAACFGCLEPGDELNLVIESAVTQAQLTAGSITIKDATPDCLREVGVLLYTNCISAEGILQQNDKPPLAKDIEVFRNSTFYANTTNLHRFQFNVVSTCVSCCPINRLIVANCCSARIYKYQGDEEVQAITTVAQACITNKSYLLINSANDTREYYVWMNVCCACCVTAPTAADTAGRIALKACIVCCTTACQVASTVGCVLCMSGNSDFGTPAVCMATVTVTWAKNGSVTDTADGTTATCFTFPCPSTQGLGECFCPSNDCVSAFMLRSNVISVGEQICETANSIVNTVNQDIARAEITTFTTVARACLTAGESFLFSNGGNTNKTQFYYDLCCMVSAPTCCNACFSTNVEIAIPCGCTTAANVATVTAAAITCATGYTASACSTTVTVTNGTTGYAPNASDVDTCYSFTITTPGKNVGISNAFYLSSECDLPGVVLFENKTLADVPFYVFADPASAYNPNFPTQNATITSTAGICSCTKTRFTTSGAHGLIAKDCVFILEEGNCGCGAHSFFGKQTVSAVPCACMTFDVNIAFSSGFGAGPCCNGFAFKITGFNSSDNESKPNRIYFSKEGQPEAVPLVNFLDVGGKDEEITRILALRDNLFILKEDGAFILTGGPAPSFAVRLLDNSTLITASDSAAVLNNQIYVLTTQGVATVSDTGIGIISRPIEDKILCVTKSGFCHKTASFGVGYESDRSYVLWLPSTSTDTVGTQAYRYNTFNQTWVRWTHGAQAGIVNPVDDKIYIASSTNNFVKQERKTGDRTDYSDAQICLCLGIQTICPCVLKVELSTVCGVGVGDALVQTQFITVSKFNRLLRKLDLDVGPTCTDYFSTQELTPGQCSAASLVSLIAKLCADISPTALPVPAACVSAACDTFTDAAVCTVADCLRVVITSACCSPVSCPAGLLDCCDVAFMVCVCQPCCTFKLSTTRGGCAINITGVGVGIHTITPTLDPAASAPSTFAIIRTDFNTLACCLNTHLTMQFSDYDCVGAACTVDFESLVTGTCASLNTACVSFIVPYVAGPIKQFEGIKAVTEWAPQHFGDPSIMKQIPEGTVVFDGNNFFDAKVAYSTDLSKDFTEFKFTGQGTGFWGGFDWGCAAWGGEGTDVPYRTLIPRQKQRCRYITVRFTHENAREEFNVLGISLEVRPLSSRGYRSIN